MSEINSPFPYFTDAQGNALENGKIYIGTANLDPRANPVTVYWDADQAITAAQPIRTHGGYPVYQGTPSNFYIDEASCSIRIEDASGRFIFQQPEYFPPSKTIGGILFSEIATSAITADGFWSSGYSTVGVGVGYYVSDATADAALLAAHPRFVAQSANGRYFRLLPPDATIEPEQGGAVGDPTEANAVNDQPVFQACLNYAYSVGIKGITLRLTQSAYSIWMPIRTSPPRSEEHTAQDGKAIIIQSDQQLSIIGTLPERSKLNFRSYGGGSFSGTTPGTNFQVVYDPVYAANYPWRGHGASILLTDVDPGIGKRSGIHLENIEWNGGTLCTRSISWPASPIDGTGWDISHKGVAAVPGDRYGGNFSATNCKLTGWRGETTYMTDNSGATQNSELSTFTVRQCEFSESNGSCFNLNGLNVDVDGAILRNACIGIEGWTGNAGSKIVNTHVFDCYAVYGTSGGGIVLQGGKSGVSARSTYYAPTRWETSVAPVGTLDITLHRCSYSYLGWWLEGRIGAIDSPVIFGGSPFGDGCQETNIDLTCITDQEGIGYPRFAGYNSAGSYTVANLNVKITHQRTAVAVAAARKATSAFDASYSLGSAVNIELDGIPAVQRVWGNSTTLHDYMPTVRGALTTTTDVSGWSQNVETTPAISLRGPVVSVRTTNTGIFTATLPTTNINTGQIMLIVNGNGTSGGIVRFNGNESSGSGVRGNGDVYLPGGRNVTMQFNGAYWEPFGKVIRKQRVTIPFIDQTGVLAVGTGKGFIRAPLAATVVGVGAWVTTAQAAGSLLTFDIMETGTTILSTKLTFDNTEKTTTTAATAAVVSDTSIAADAELRADITQVGTPAAIGGGVWLDIIPN